MSAHPETRKPRPKFRTKWGELEHLCATINRLAYAEGEKAKAKRYLPRLQRLLDELPKNDMAILRQDGLALLAELTGHVDDAIKHRKREIMLMKRLHQDVESKGYAKEMRASILINRDTGVLEERCGILESLQKQTLSNGAAAKTARRRQAPS